MSAWVRWAIQRGSRTGARVSVSEARMMRRLVCGAVMTWTRTTTAWRTKPPRDPRPGEADLTGRPATGLLPRAQSPEQKTGRWFSRRT
ncbi:hypothetical protein [Streptomyces sp. NPDC060010]|uniref:hypothetical protein n=1 Tax=Streptomyces sp. NPDC060010 TaxID=3347036 RepID=UPI00369E934F